MTRIGDGTGPPGWPAYGRNYVDVAHVSLGLVCKFKNCGHTGVTMQDPLNRGKTKMSCKGLLCECSCCQLLSGAQVHGLRIG